MRTGIIPGVAFPAFRPDLQNQLLCELLRCDKAVLDSLAQRMAVINWADFTRLAVSQQLAGAVYPRLRLLHREGLAPQAALDSLHAAYLAQVGEGMKREYWLKNILLAFRNKDIQVIPLKGAYLAGAVYADSAERLMSDFDLLVHEKQLAETVQVLEGLGYQPGRKFWLDVELQASHELPPFMKEGAPPIEIHWRLLEPELPFKVDLAGLWQRAVPVQIAGQPCLGLCAEDLLLHICLHATTQHRFLNGLRNIYDVAATLVHFRETLDWDTLLQRTQEWHAERAVYLMFWLAVDLFGSPVPKAILRKLQPSDFSPGQVALAYQLLFSHPEQQSSFPIRLAEVAQARSLWLRVNLVLRQIFLSPQEIARRYPVRPDSWKLPLYYPVRWRDLLIHRTRQTWALLRRDPHAVAQAEVKYNRQSDEDQLISWVLGGYPDGPIS